MATTTPLQGIPHPEATDPDNVPADLSNALGYLEGRLVMRFDSATARDATIPAPVEGMLCWLRDLDRYEYHDGAAWRALVRPGGAWSAFTLTDAGSSGLVLGDASLSATWRRLDDKTAAFRIQLILGSTSDVTGVLSLGPLPFDALSAQVVAGTLYRNSTAVRAISAQVSGASVTRLYTGDGLTVDALTPWDWAQGNTIRLSGVVETA